MKTGSKDGKWKWNENEKIKNDKNRSKDKKKCPVMKNLTQKQWKINICNDKKAIKLEK